MSVGIPMGNIKAMGVFQKSVDLASNAATTTAETTITVPGVKVGDFIFVNKPSHSAGLGIVNARVSADDTVILTTVNPTAGAIDPAAETYTFLWLRPETQVSGIVQ